MKHLLYGIIGLMFSVITIMSVVTLSQASEREQELQSALPDAVKQAVTLSEEDGNYKIQNNDELIALMTKQLSDQINVGEDDNYDKNLTLTVEVLGVDEEKGLLSVKATETYTKLNGKIGNVSAESTVVVDKYTSTIQTASAENVYFQFSDGSILYTGQATTSTEAQRQESEEKLKENANNMLKNYSIIHNSTTGETIYYASDKAEEYAKAHFGTYYTITTFQSMIDNYTFKWIEKERKDNTVYFELEFAIDEGETPKTRTLTLNPNGGTIYNQSDNFTVDCTYDYAQTLPTAFLENTKNNQTTRLGTFLGWYDKDGEYVGKGGDTVDCRNLTATTSTKDTDNITLTAKWEYVVYTIHYELNEGTVSANNPTTYTAGDKNFKLNNPTKTGYEFVGWTGSNGTTPQKDVTVDTRSGENLQYEANWELQTYTISFVEKDGKTPVQGVESITYQTGNIIYIPEPDKNDQPFGYDFIGWTGDVYTTPTKNITLDKTYAKDITFTANWEANGDTLIHCDYNGGKNEAEKENEDLVVNIKDSTDVILPIPTKEDYLVDYITNSANEKIEKNDSGQFIATVTKEDTFTYHWKYAYYYIEFESFDDTQTTGTQEKMTCKVDELETLPESTIKFKNDRYIFWHYNTKKDDTGITYGPNSNVKNLAEPGKTITLYAQFCLEKWDLIVKDYQNGDDLKANMTFINDTFKLEPKKTGYTFDKWEIEKGCEEYIDSFENNVITTSDDVTLTAKWKANTYTITFNSNGGNTPSQTSATVTYDKAIGTLPTVTKNCDGSYHYTFAGWFTAASGGTQVTANTIYKTASDVTYYAHWTATAHSNRIYSSSGATCTSASTENHICDACGYTWVTHATAAYGHATNFAHDSEATCTTNGVGHYYCSRCGATWGWNTVHAYAVGHDFPYLVANPDYVNRSNFFSPGGGNQNSPYWWTFATIGQNKNNKAYEKICNIGGTMYSTPDSAMLCCLAGNSNAGANIFTESWSIDWNTHVQYNNCRRCGTTQVYNGNRMFFMSNVVWSSGSKKAGFSVEGPNNGTCTAWWRATVYCGNSGAWASSDGGSGTW